jgi:hypothetical protein
VIDSGDVLTALRLWHGGETEVWPLTRLRLGLQIRDEADAHSSLAEAGQAAYNRAILSRGLERLRLVSPEAEELLRERFEHRRDVLTVANRLNISESSLYYRQRQAISHLTEILNHLEEQARSEWRERMYARLALPTYAQLVGVEEPRRLLQEALLDGTANHIVSIDGLGGIGKTALADRVTRDLVKTFQFDEFAWITAKHTHLSMRGRLQIESGRPALTMPMVIEQLGTQFEIAGHSNLSQLQTQRLVKRFLQDRHCLIVIDNLETAADYRSLLPELQKLQNPSKFLLTSRFRLLDELGVFSVSLSELTEEAALQLIRLEAERTGFTALSAAEDNQLQQIFQVVGGNPLALKLIVGQLRFYSLSRVLDRFRQGKQAASDDSLFDYIYSEIWESLADDSKIVLLALTEAGETGFPIEHISGISGLTEAKVASCLEDLVLLSLVDLAGTLDKRRYRLHRLTQVYLLKVFAEA